jgi:hypothetical protein
MVHAVMGNAGPMVATQAKQEGSRRGAVNSSKRKVGGWSGRGVVAGMWPAGKLRSDRHASNNKGSTRPPRESPPSPLCSHSLLLHASSPQSSLSHHYRACATSTALLRPLDSLQRAAAGPELYGSRHSDSEQQQHSAMLLWEQRLRLPCAQWEAARGPRTRCL